MTAAAYKAVLGHGLQQRSNYQGWRLVGLAAALVSLALLALVILGRPKVARLAGGNLFIIVTALYWGGMVVNLALQNHPNSARLVPGHLARLRQVLVAGWLLSSLLLMLPLMVMGLAPLPAWLVAAWSMAALGLLMRWPLGWTLLSMLPFGLIWFYRHGGFAEAAALMEARPVLCSLLSLLIPPLALLPVLGDGGPSHRNSHARAERWRDMARSTSTKGWDSASLPAPLSWFGMLTNGPYRHQLQQLSARSDAGSVQARLMLGLGPAAHWTAQVSGILIFGGIIGLVCLASLWIPISFVDFARGASFGMTIGLMSTLLSPLTGLANTLLKTRNEQRLLVLLPGVPRGKALNLMLARRWLAQYALTWLLCAVVSTGVMFFSDSPMELLLPFLLAYLLPLAMVWRDWARLPGNGLQGALVMIFCVVASALLGYGLYRWAGVPIWLYCGVQLAVILCLGLWRWRQQQAAPQALPVGRLG